MAIIRDFAGDSLSTTSLTKRLELGSRCMFLDAKYGWQEYLYVYNADVISLTAGGIVQHKTADTTGFAGISCVTAKTQKGQLLGVAQFTIPTLAYGWILVSGVGLIRGDGNVTKDLPVRSEGTTGRAMIATMTNLDEVISAFAVSIDDDGAADSVFPARIRCV
jgi:hypothetical protein